MTLWLSEAVLDRYASDDGTTAVMVDNRVVVLADLAGRVLDLVDGGVRDVEELASRLVAIFGAPPGGDGVSSTQQVVDDLVSQQVLVFRAREL